MLRQLVLGLCFVLTALLGESALADEAEKLRLGKIPLRLPLPEGVEGPVAATLRMTPLNGPLAGKSHGMPIELPTRLLLTTVEGEVASLELELDGYWSPPQVVVSRVDTPPVSFDFFRTGKLSGILQAPQDAPVPEKLILRFEQAAGREGERMVPRGFVTCPVEEGRFRCELPSGLLDLRLRAEGFVSQYFWTFPVPVGGEFPLGRLRLRQGGSIVGFVALEDPAASFEGVTVRASPLEATHDQGADQDRHRLLEDQVEVNARGFFHLRGLPPGQYRVLAEKKGYGRALVETTAVQSDAETTLPAALVVTPPGRFELRLDPPRDPFGGDWSISLQEANPSRTAFDLVGLGSTDAQGAWRSKELPHGTYALVVEDSVGSRWLREEVDLDEPREIVERSLAGVMVDGRISLGDEPLEATLWFGGRFGERSIQIHSDAEGRFGGLLPEEGDWPVYVEAEEPRVARNLRAVAVETLGAGDAAQVAIELPDRTLAGRVLDAAGRPVAASLLLQPHENAGSPDQERTNEDGEFELHGLDVGTYTVQAYASRLSRTSQPVEVEIVADREPPYLELRLNESRIVQGQVLAPLHAVPGASISAVPQDAGGRALTQVLPAARTDVQGRFTLTVPEATRTLDLVILPPGFTLTTTRLSLPEGEGISEQSLPVHSAGGTLRVKLEEEFEPGIDSMITVAREGIEIGYGTALRWARLQQGGWTAPGELSLPNLDFGSYEVCVHRSREPTCRSVFLPPGGSLQLSFER